MHRIEKQSSNQSRLSKEKKNKKGISFKRAKRDFQIASSSVGS